MKKIISSVIVLVLIFVVGVTKDELINVINKSFASPVRYIV